MRTRSCYRAAYADYAAFLGVLCSTNLFLLTKHTNYADCADETVIRAHAKLRHNYALQARGYASTLAEPLPSQPLRSYKNAAHMDSAKPPSTKLQISKAPTIRESGLARFTSRRTHSPCDSRLKSSEQRQLSCEFLLFKRLMHTRIRKKKSSSRIEATLGFMGIHLGAPTVVLTHVYSRLASTWLGPPIYIWGKG